jgi:hypothetical protein
MNDSSLSLGSERTSTLDTAFEIIQQAWEGFDSARPGQPPTSSKSLNLLSFGLPNEGVGAIAAL